MEEWRKSWWWQVIVAMDRLCAAILGAWADETLSSYAWRLEQQGSRWGHAWRRFIDLIFSRWEHQHCYNAYLRDRLMDKVPPLERENKSVVT
jgi:hypothetical protein